MPLRAWTSTAALVLALALLGAAARPTACEESDTVKGILNRPDNKLPLSQVLGAKYLDRILSRYNTDEMDSAAALEMLVAQQRWRRGATKERLDETGHPYDCKPTYKITRSTTRWFQRRTVEVGLCFTVCADYPACTATAPLVYDATDPGNPELAVLLRCGLYAFNNTFLRPYVEMMEVVIRSGDGSVRPVCRNVVDRAGDQPGVDHGKPISPPPAANSEDREGLTVQAFGRIARSHDDELTIYTHDLWSHWRLPMLAIRNVWADQSNVTQAFIMPPTYRVNDLLNYDGQNVRNLMAPASQAIVLDGALLVRGDPGNSVALTYAVMRPDLGGRWYAIFTFGHPNSWSNYVDINGPCPKVERTMWEIAAEWNVSHVVTGIAEAPACHYLDTPNVTSYDHVGGWWADAATRIYGRQERKKKNVHCPLALNQTEWNSSVYTAVPGCDNNATFLLTAFTYDREEGSHCLSGRLSMLPAVEGKLRTGARPETTADAWAYHTKVLSSSDTTPEQRAALLVDGGGNGEREYYVLMDAGLQWNVSDLQRLMLSMLAQAEHRLHELDMDDKTQAAVIVAFTTLLIATVTIPSHFNTDMRVRVIAFGRRFLKLRRKGALLALVTSVRFFASALVVGPAIFSFLSVLAQNAGTRVSDGFPTISYQVSTHPPCHDIIVAVGHRPDDPAIGIVATTLTETRVQTGAVVVICCLCCVAVLVAALLSIPRAAKLLAEQEGIGCADGKVVVKPDMESPATAP